MSRWRTLAAICAGVVSLAVGQPEQVRVGIPDLDCTVGPHSATWAKVKRGFRDLFEADASRAFTAAPRDDVVAAIEGAVKVLGEVNALGPEAMDCGFGRVILQMASLLLVDDPPTVVQFLSNTEALASPIMTVLLDVPWIETAMSGWPFFGLLAQLGHHKVRVLKATLQRDVVDGLEDRPTKTYYDQIMAAQRAVDVGGMVLASAEYMAAPVEEGKSILALLTAMTARITAQGEVETRLKLLQSLQGEFREVMGRASELEAALSTQWPLWSLLHVAVDAFA
eukprot:TRINITY_DN38973_c0_g1_i1.p1 TRINITY_DN38973_c0_g1~~TRINITY_DN38973_c0_g1_i1.p1  ORF type:complete len:281 (-),score=68.83 TRINITY_DN38973_c0_g1_i1:74-916(-)